MNKYKNTLLFATALVVVSSPMAQAGKLTVINKLPTQKIHLCIRGEGSEERTYKDCVSRSVKPGEQAEYILSKEHVRGENTFEVIASTHKPKKSDWNLMGGSCTNLVTDADHTIIISSTLGKLSCKDVTATNPTSNP